MTAFNTRGASAYVLKDMPHACLPRDRRHAALYVVAPLRGVFARHM